MCDAIKKAGAQCELIPIEGGGHGMTNWEKVEAQQLQWKPQLVAWLRKTWRSVDEAKSVLTIPGGCVRRGADAYRRARRPRCRK